MSCVMSPMASPTLIASDKDSVFSTFCVGSSTVCMSIIPCVCCLGDTSSNVLSRLSEGVSENM